MTLDLVNPAVQSFNASNRLVVPVTFGPTTVSGTSSATDASSLTDSGASFTAHALIGLTVYSNGSSGVITENTTTAISTTWTGGTPTAVKPYMVAAAGVTGPIGTTTLGTISSAGVVMVRDIVVVVGTGLTAVGTTSRVKFGVTGTTNLFISPAATDAATLSAGSFIGASGAATGGLAVAAAASDTSINANVILTITAENILTGALTAYIYWDPISAGATLS